MNAQKEYAGLIENSLLARRIFEVQKMLEETPGGMDWKKLFKLLLKEISEHIERDSPEAEHWAEKFMQEFKDIEMADTIYPDIPQAFQKLAEQAAEVVLWTMGDLVNDHQKIKIQKSGILDLLDRADGGVRINTVIAIDKFSALPALLEKFWEKEGQPSRLVVAAYEDSVNHLTKLKAVLDRWSLAKGLPVEQLYIRARCGRQADDPLPKDFNLFHEQARTFTEAVSLLEQKIIALGLTRNQVLVLLDFDGVLSDNCLMRLRQAEVVFKYIAKAISNIDSKYYGIPAKFF